MPRMRWRSLEGAVTELACPKCSEAFAIVTEAIRLATVLTGIASDLMVERDAVAFRTKARCWFRLTGGDRAE